MVFFIFCSLLSIEHYINFSIPSQWGSFVFSVFNDKAFAQLKKDGQISYSFASILHFLHI